MGVLLKDRPNEVCDDTLGAAKIMDCIKDMILLSTERDDTTNVGNCSNADANAISFQA